MDTLQLSAVALVGKEIRGYRLDALIAQGGFGQVYRAFQKVVDRHVAIKVVQPQYANQPAFVRRFEVEAQLVAQLEHPHIVPMYDYWRDATGAYLVMRLLRGGSLTDLIDRLGGPLPLDLTARILDQVAAALTTAHRGGVIHRDMKPANVLLDEERNAYLADFGIAKRLFGEDEWDMERFGSPAYVAPEQVSSDVVSAQTDIYSLGIILYEMLTGTLPFSAPSQTLLLQQHLTGEVPSLNAVRPDLPEEVNYVIRRAMQRHPKDRYADALAMAQDFRRMVGGHEESLPSATGTPSRPRGSDAPGKTMILNISAVAQKNPYKGLRAFQEADAVDFYGRETVVTRLLTRLRATGMRSRCIALIGPSGSGKSSLARAGLLPALRRGAVPGSNKWFFAVMSPGSQPFTELEETIGRVAVKTPAGMAAKLRAKPDLIDNLIETLLPPGGEFVLVVDQLEEVFSLVEDPAERDAFLNTLATLAKHPHARLILTLRADFYDRPLLHPAFGDLLRECSEVVLPLSATEMEAVITKPAERLGVAFEPGLTARMIQDVSSQPGALPLLQYVLYELFEHRSGDVLTIRAYEGEGGVFGALARRAEELYNDLDAPEQAAAQRLFLRLVNVGEGADDTRRRLTQAEALGGGLAFAQMEKVLEAFGHHRLLTFDRDSVTRAPTVEIAHEALIRQWNRLRDWIDQNRALLRQRQQLAASAAEWDAGGREPGYLARGARLGSFEALLASESVPLDERSRAYLDASLDDRRRETRRTQRQIFTLAIIALVAVVAAGIALFLQTEATRERDRADRQARISRSGELAIVAVTNQDNLALSLLLSLEALNIADTVPARDSLLNGLQASPRLQTILYGEEAAGRAIAVSPDGHTVAVGAADGSIYLWSLDDRRAPPHVLSGHEGPVNTVAFSPDGMTIASGGSDATVRLWDVAAQAQLGEPLTGHDGGVWSVAFSPDGALLASSGEDATIRLWSLETREPQGEPLTGHDGYVFAVAFSPDGRTLASGGDDQTVRIWDVETGEPIGDPLEGHPNWVLNLTYSPDGTLLASSDAFGFVFLWDVAADYAISGNPIRVETPDPRDQNVHALAFSPDGQTLATGGDDNIVRLWDVASHIPTDTLRAHTDDVRAIAFGAGGTLVSTGLDRQVLVWNAAERSVPAAERVAQADYPLMGLTRSADGTHLATALLDNNTGAIAQVWDAATDEVLGTLRTDAGQATALAFLPDGESLVTIDDSGDVLTWNWAQGDDPVGVTQLPLIPYAMALDPARQIVAAGGDSPLIFIYDLQAPSTPIASFNITSTATLALTFSPDGSLLMAGDELGWLYSWDTDTWEAIQPFDTEAGAISALAYSADGGLLAVGTRAGAILIYDTETRELARQPLRGHEDWITDLIFVDGDTVASSSQDNSVRLWTISTGESLALAGHTDWVNGVAAMPDGSLVSAGRDRQLIAWDLRPGTWRERACTIVNRDLTTIEWERYFPNEPYHATCSSELGDES